MQTFLVYGNMVINLLATLVAAWVLAMPKQPRLLKVIAAIMCAGGLANMYGLVWFGYHSVWPGELVFNLGALGVLAWLARNGRQDKDHIG